jgi:uncharacterized repeat protein (TIGR01451 family)
MLGCRLALLTAALLTAGTVTAALAVGVPVQASSSNSAGVMSVAVTSNPNPVSSGQAMAYTITAANTGGAAATGVTITDTITDLVPAAPQTVPFFDTSLGNCGYNATTSNVTCTAPSVAAGQVWTVTITAQMTAPPGTVLPEVATVTGTESGASFSASAATTTTVNQGLPAGFAQTQLAHGLAKPDVIAFAPGGDIYVGEQGGTILIYRNGALLAAPVVTVPNVASQGESGLLGLAFDPSFAANGYLYVSYTAAVTNKAGATQPFAQLSRFTVVNDTISPATEKVYYRGNQAQNPHHPGNDLKVGPDGKLWWSVGDNVPAISNAKTLTNIYGKILRFNLDGTIPADNPFVNVPGAIPAIYAYGLRNPFRFTFLPNGSAMTEDTGSSYWEELDTIQPGGNYGWPLYEGNCFSCGAVNPAYAFGHYPVDGAASAITAYSGSAFPAQYDHVVFFGDYNRRDIQAVSFDPGYQTETSDTVFDTNAGTIADLAEGPDGNLYFVSIFEGTFSKISAPGPFPAAASAGSATRAARTTTQVAAAGTLPTASITAPATYNAGDTVAFSGTATDPADGTLPAYDYRWKTDFYSNGVAAPSYRDEVPYSFYGPATGVTAGTFQIPADPSQTPSSFYRITLTVTDSSGLQTVVTKDIHPNLTSWSAGANVPGAGYSVDGTWHTGPFTTQDVVGVRHVLGGMPLAQAIGGTRYRFAGWADGSALTDAFTSGASPATYTAHYDTAAAALPPGWQSTDVGAPITAGAAGYAASDQAFYLDGAGADVYGANDQFRYAYQTLNGDGTIVARVRYQTNSDAWAKAGVMIKQSATAGAPFADALVTPDVSPATPNINGVGCDANGCLSPLPPVVPAVGHGVRMQYSGSHSATGATLAGYSSPDKWLKLQKSAATFTSWESADGVNWTQIGIATVNMTGPVTAGLFVTSHDIGQPSTVAFDNVQVTPAPAAPPPGPLPPGWADADVGFPAIAGSAGYGNGVFTVTGAGAGIWGASDQFHYVYQPLAGNGTIIARVASQTNTSANAKAGIMFKQSATAGSGYIMIATGPGGVVKVQYNFSGSAGGGTYTFPNVWMKLIDVGGTFTASLSGDGITWTQVLSKALAITSPATAGLFECSHNATAAGTATFDKVSFTAGA